MTNLKNEIQNTWKVFSKNVVYFIAIITSLFAFEQLNIFVKGFYISAFTTMILTPLTAFLQLITVYIVVKYNKNEEINMKAIINSILHEFKEIIIIVALQLVVLFIAAFALIPIIPLLLAQVFMIFVWPIYIIERTQRLEVLKKSAKLVFLNMKDLSKYIGVYAGVVIVVSIMTISKRFNLSGIERGTVMFASYFGKFATIFFTMLTTRLYFKYNEEGNTIKELEVE